MQRGRGRVKSDIAGHDLLFSERVERWTIGQLVDITAALKQAKQVGLIVCHGALRLAWSFELANISMRCHQNTPALKVNAIDVTYEIQPDGQLWLRYFVTCDPDLLVYPSTESAVRTDGLWTSSCFELFLRDPRETDYFEYNFAPSGAWAAYHFHDYRDGMTDLPLEPPEIHIEGSDSHFALEVNLSLPKFAPMACLAGLSAVIHEKEDCKSYWALNHPPGKPDFHHRDCFALQLAAPALP